MAKIRVFEGVTNDTVALTMGFGHTAFGEFNDSKGMDVMALVTPLPNRLRPLRLEHYTRERRPNAKDSIIMSEVERIRHQMDDGRRS